MSDREGSRTNDDLEQPQASSVSGTKPGMVVNRVDGVDGVDGVGRADVTDEGLRQTCELTFFPLALGIGVSVQAGEWIYP